MSNYEIDFWWWIFILHFKYVWTLPTLSLAWFFFFHIEFQTMCHRCQPDPINSHLCMYWNQLKKPYLSCIVHYLTNWRARLSIDSSLKSLGNQTIQWESICTTFVAKVGWDSAWLSMWPIWSALRYTSASKRLGVKNNLKEEIIIQLQFQTKDWIP